MTQAIGRFAVASLLMCLSHGVADAQDVATPWDVCLKAPVRACVLEEALSLALSIDAKGQRARLLRGASQGSAAASRGITVSDSSANASKQLPAAPYANPYYWAPFILIGNWK